MSTVHFVAVRKKIVHTYLCAAYALIYPTNRQNEFYFINLLILLVKFQRHESKFSNAKPSFQCFMNETRQYFKTIQQSHNIKEILLLIQPQPAFLTADIEFCNV